MRSVPKKEGKNGITRQKKYAKRGHNFGTKVKREGNMAKRGQKEGNMAKRGKIEGKKEHIFSCAEVGQGMHPPPPP